MCDTIFKLPLSLVFANLVMTHKTVNMFYSLHREFINLCSRQHNLLMLRDGFFFLLLFKQKHFFLYTEFMTDT